jgi:hypothetical protein
MTFVLSTLLRADRHQLFHDIAEALQNCPVNVSMRDEDDRAGTIVFALGSRLSAVVLLRESEDTFPPAIHWRGNPLRLNSNMHSGGVVRERAMNEDAISLALTFDQLVARLAAGFCASRDGSSFTISTQ